MGEQLTLPVGSPLKPRLANGFGQSLTRFVHAPVRQPLFWGADFRLREVAEDEFARWEAD